MRSVVFLRSYALHALHDLQAHHSRCGPSVLGETLSALRLDLLVSFSAVHAALAVLVDFERVGAIPRLHSASLFGFPSAPATEIDNCLKTLRAAVGSSARGSSAQSHAYIQFLWSQP
jgi:hypothetical protein